MSLHKRPCMWRSETKRNDSDKVDRMWLIHIFICDVCACVFIVRARCAFSLRHLWIFDYAPLSDIYLLQFGRVSGAFHFVFSLSPFNVLCACVCVLLCCGIAYGIPQKQKKCQAPGAKCLMQKLSHCWFGQRESYTQSAPATETTKTIVEIKIYF